ncbi:hypothetical protein CEXT_657711 [Caerostris extrusa]|uniref:Uncharacterized protein n=1 Tax=Caerostris extrusa TaxID=172846 RepID=A0AAV4NFN8_CAEEX|nr:hypothetical protein CEXT_657711 [Caerostris extrusa]
MPWPAMEVLHLLKIFHCLQPKSITVKNKGVEVNRARRLARVTLWNQCCAVFKLLHAVIPEAAEDSANPWSLYEEVVPTESVNSEEEKAKAKIAEEEKLKAKIAEEEKLKAKIAEEEKVEGSS